MRQKNTVRTIIASFLLMLATGTMLVKSVHCVFIPHDFNVVVSNDKTVLEQEASDSCPICSFDFYPVFLHSLRVLPEFTPFTFSKFTFSLAAAPILRATTLFLLRAPPVV